MKELNCTQIQFLHAALALVKDGYNSPLNNQVNNAVNAKPQFANDNCKTAPNPSNLKATYDELLKMFNILP